MSTGETILNSKLFKKIEQSDDFFTISDLLMEIYKNISDDREKILELLSKAMNDSDELKESIKEYNEISELPNIMIFGDIPNKYLQNLNDNVSSQIQLLNAIQKLQSNWVKRSESKGSGKPDEEELTLSTLLSEQKHKDVMDE